MKKRLVIAVDCDDVIVETYPKIIDWYNRAFGTHLELADAYSTDLNKWGVDHADVAIGRVNDFLEAETDGLQPIEAAIDTLQDLAGTHVLHLITGRADFLQLATERWITRHLPGVFATVQFTNFIVSTDRKHTSRTKLEVCRQVGADVLVDDHLHHAEQVAAGGIPVILFGDYPWNQTDKGLALPPNVVRAANWPAVLASLSAGL